MVRNWRPDGPFDWLHDAAIVRRQLEMAHLWWVTTEMCDLLASSAPTYPNDAVLNMAEVKTLSGFAVFEDDFEGIDADPAFRDLDRKVRTSAVLWGPSRLPPINGVLRPGISFSFFTRIELQEGMGEDDLLRCMGHLAALSHHTGEQGSLSGTLFAYMGRTDWLDGWSVDEVIPDNPHGDDPQTLASMAEDRRLMASLWLLTQTPRLVATREARLDRPTRRRAQREGYDPSVKVVTLANYDYEPGDASAPSVEHRREWKHQWVVGPHHCWQPYGPGNKQRKLIVRGPFTKGPKDKPLLGGERVWKVVPPT
jgi:hypothetical protein